MSQNLIVLSFDPVTNFDLSLKKPTLFTYYPCPKKSFNFLVLVELKSITLLSVVPVNKNSLYGENTDSTKICEALFPYIFPAEA